MGRKNGPSFVGVWTVVVFSIPLMLGARASFFDITTPDQNQVVADDAGVGFDASVSGSKSIHLDKGLSKGKVDIIKFKTITTTTTPPPPPPQPPHYVYHTPPRYPPPPPPPHGKPCKRDTEGFDATLSGSKSIHLEKDKGKVDVIKFDTDNSTDPPTPALPPQLLYNSPPRYPPPAPPAPQAPPHENPIKRDTGAFDATISGSKSIHLDKELNKGDVNVIKFQTLNTTTPPQPPAQVQYNAPPRYPPPAFPNENLYKRDTGAVDASHSGENAMHLVNHTDAAAHENPNKRDTGAAIDASHSGNMPMQMANHTEVDGKDHSPEHQAPPAPPAPAHENPNKRDTAGVDAPHSDNMSMHVVNQTEADAKDHSTGQPAPSHANPNKRDTGSVEASHSENMSMHVVNHTDADSKDHSSSPPASQHENPNKRDTAAVDAPMHVVNHTDADNKDHSSGPPAPAAASHENPNKRDTEAVGKDMHVVNHTEVDGKNQSSGPPAPPHENPSKRDTDAIVDASHSSGNKSTHLVNNTESDDGKEHSKRAISPRLSGMMGRVMDYFR